MRTIGYGVVALIGIAAGAAAAAGGAAGWTGRYSARFDGGTGGFTITGSGRAGYHIDMEVAARGCAGQLVADGQAVGNSLVFTLPDGEDGGQCRITVTRAGRHYTVSEDDCLYYHGFACNFEGTARKSR